MNERRDITAFSADNLLMAARGDLRAETGVSADSIEGEIGRRVVFAAPMSEVAGVERPRVMPVSGPPKGFINATKPAAANVLIVFRRPVRAKVLGMPRSISQLALRLDEPAAFIHCCQDT